MRAGSSPSPFPLDAPPPWFFPGLFPGSLPLPPDDWFDPGLARSTKTITGEEPDEYAAARHRLETLVKHPFTFVVANGYYHEHEMALHDDKPDLWGAVAIVSLGEPCDFSLIPAEDAARKGPRRDKPGHHFTFEHGDVVYLTEAANRYWWHGGLMVPGRYSLVMRERG